jgi:NTP pyrophosphatase (non-canonical NTP hydrolase)
MHDTVLRTWRLDLPREMRLANAALGLMGESGEVIEHIKKHLFHGHDIDSNAIMCEIGDVYFYLAALEMELGLTRELCESAVKAKLEKRYPEGFCVDCSLDRKDHVSGG